LSDIRANTISDAAGTGPIALTGQSAAKAWVNFDQYYTNTIRDSYNVSSVSDDAVGKHTITYSNSMNNASYTANATASNHVSTLISCTGSGSAFAAASVEVTTTTTTAFGDNERSCTSIHGDLA